MKRSSYNIPEYNKYYLFFGNLANPLRIEIITCLKEKDMNVGEISKKIGVEQSKLSHALSNLRECNIVNVKQKGKERVYSLNRKTILPMLKIIDNHAQINCKGNCAICKIKH